MKRIAIVVTVLALNGCAIYDALMMTKYDPNEYLLITQIRTDASVYKTQCDTPMAVTNAVQMSYKTNLFKNYSQNIPKNDTKQHQSCIKNPAQGGVKHMK